MDVAGAPRATAGRPMVLVVDDNPAMAEMLTDGLIDHELDACACQAGAAALDHVRGGGVEVIVTDLRMPEIDGLTLLDRARAIDPDVQVIVMTAHGAIDSAVESIRRGAFHYLTKPFKLDELVRLVRRAIAERPPRGGGAGPRG